MARLSTFTRLSKRPLALKPPLETSRFPFFREYSIGVQIYVGKKKYTIINTGRFIPSLRRCRVVRREHRAFRTRNQLDDNVLQQTSARFRQVDWTFYNLLRQFLLFCENRSVHVHRTTERSSNETNLNFKQRPDYEYDRFDRYGPAWFFLTILLIWNNDVVNFVYHHFSR